MLEIMICMIVANDDLISRFLHGIIHEFDLGWPDNTNMFSLSLKNKEYVNTESKISIRIKYTGRRTHAACYLR